MLIITETTVQDFRLFLTEREYSPATITKYAHDLRLLMDYAPDGIPDKAALVGFRAYLTERGYAPTSVNSILGAVNVFFELLGLDWRLKYLPIQRKLYLDADKELSQREYERMVRTAEQGSNTHLSLLVQTLCDLGLRVSELKAITVESLESSEETILNDEFIILLWVFTFSEKLSNPWENAKLYRVKIHENVPDCQAPSHCF